MDITRQHTAQAELETYRNQMEQNKVLIVLGAAGSEIVSYAIPHLYRSKMLFSRVLSELRDLPLEESVRPALHDGLSNLSEVLRKLEITYSKLGIHVPQEQPIDIHRMVQGILSVFQGKRPEGRFADHHRRHECLPLPLDAAKGVGAGLFHPDPVRNSSV